MENQVKIYNLNRVLSIKQGNALKGKFLDDSHYKLVIDHDADGYDAYGNLLFRYRKNAIPLDVLKLGYESFKGSIEETEGRGTASGSSHKRILKDGTVSNITVGNKVLSGNVGFMDAGAMVRYCRKTAFAKKYFDKFTAGIPFVEHIDQLYAQLCPEHYKRQKAIADATDINYRIGKTAFTTVTVNKNFRTACHQDAGDYREGFGNLAVYREGSYKGGYFTLPEFGAAIDMQNGDMLFADVHRWHGNTEITETSDDWLRISFVLYYREYMIKCLKPSEELKRVKMQQGGYLKL